MLALVAVVGSPVATFTSARELWAACPLPRPLALPATMDAKLRCEHDEDDNGLDDEMERVVAECVAPMLVFKPGSYQPAQAVAFSAAQTAPSTFRFQYGFFWPSDGGHTEESCVPGDDMIASCSVQCADACAAAGAVGLIGFGICMATCEPGCLTSTAGICETASHSGLNAHPGDAQGLSVLVDVVPTSYNYEARFKGFFSGTETEKEYVGTFPFGTTHSDARTPSADGDRVVIYVSPGKHHFYAWSGTSEYARAFGPSGGSLFCKGRTAVPSGASELPIESTFTVGVSANSVSVLYKKFKHQSYRCDCEGASDCLDDPGSDCFRGKMRPDPVADTWQSWRAIPTPGCSVDAQGYCLPGSRLLQVNTEQATLTTWNWVEEWTQQPDHFRPGSVHPQSGLFTAGVLGSDDKFAIRTAFDDGDVLYEVPGSGLSWDPRYSLYPEPDVGPEAVQIGIDQVSSEKNRRLRSSVSEKLVQPIAEYDAMIDTGERFPPLELGSWLPFVTGYRDPIDEGWYEFVARPGGLERLQLRRTADNRLRGVTVDASVPEWARGAGAAGALPGGRGAFAVVGEDSVQLGGRPEPTIMWLETSTLAATRWALLSPTDSTLSTTTYALSAEGEAPFGLSRAAVVVTDPVNERIAVVDPTAGVVALYDPMLRRWSPHTVPAVRRVGASFVLDGSALMVAGGEVEGTLATDLLVVDVLTGTSVTRPGFPARRDAVLALARDDHALVFAGGLDAAGNQHDDIWTLAYRSPAAVGTKLSGDTIGGGIRAGAAMLDVSARTHDLQAVILSSDGYPERRQRVEGGWRALDAGLGQPACALADATGGELCSLPGSTVWSTPGRRPCASATTEVACQGATGDVAHTRRLGAGAVAVGASNDTAWTLRRRILERRRLNDRLEDESVTSVALASPARAMAVTDEGAVVATDDGFMFVAVDATSASGAPVETCGRPVAVQSVSPGVWVGLTTLGVTLLSTSDGALGVKYSSLLVRPDRPTDHGHDHEDDAEEPTLLPLLPEPERGRLCGAAQRRLGEGRCRALGSASALLAIGQGEVLVRRGAYYARVRAGAEAFTGTPWVKSERVEALRYDALGERAYGSIRHGTIVFDLRAAGVTTHEAPLALDAWIERKEAGSLSVLLDKEKVMVARVVR
ncbi:MAG: hypothetical protein IT374_22005 [Polyangiaceae bacterium]|nr:hypothetical protein [Polyangiaceae bacterium]